MIDVISQMLAQYNAGNIDEKRNAIKEVIQSAVLVGLSKAGFFNKAAFYGGTALRIFYGLDRFSEDLDFSLLAADPDYELSKYFSSLSDELSSLGLDFSVEEKRKSVETNERSAFVKGNTREHLLKFYPSSAMQVPYNELIKIKFEVDTAPPLGFCCEFRTLLLPAPCKIRLYDLGSLFAGKIHALLCRNWTRTKGRDLYDYLFYLARRSEINLTHLKAKLEDSGFLSKNVELTIPLLVSFLDDKFKAIDYSQAKNDVKPFIKDISSLNLWDADFFISTTHQYLLNR